MNKQWLWRIGTMLLIIVLGNASVVPSGAQPGEKHGLEAASDLQGWKVVPSNIGNSLHDVDMLNSSEGWAVGTLGTIMHYANAEWEPYWLPIDAAITGVDALSETDVWAVTSQGQIYHLPGSLPWVVTYEDKSVWLNDIYMASGDRGWAVGSDGTLLAYRNGSWYGVLSGGSNWLEAIDMLPDLSDGWLVGGDAIYRWSGSSWKLAESLPTFWLQDVDMVTKDDVWVVGGHLLMSEGTLENEGAIYHYDGLTWTMTQTTTHPLESVSMVAADDGWIVGEQGQMLYYDGDVWTALVTSIDIPLHEVQMLGPDEGWAVGNWGRILRYSPPPDLSTSFKAVTVLSGTSAITLTYNIELRNTGEQAATTVSVTDTIPSGTMYVPDSAVATTGTISGPDPLVLVVDVLEPGQEVSFGFDVTVEDNPGAGCRFIGNEAIIETGGITITRGVRAAVGRGCVRIFLPLVIRND